MGNLVKEFNDYRQKMNDVILSKITLSLNASGTSTPIPTLKAHWIPKPRK
jgi:hypothetical protein